jgi:hypothetical protein
MARGKWKGVSHRDELMIVFHIGPEDLAANRAGRLGQRQIHRMRRGVLTNLALALLLVVALLLILYFVAERPFAWIQYVLAGLLVFGALAVGFFAARGLRRAVAAGVVECLTGPVKVTMRGRSGMWLAVQDRSFHLPVRFWHVGSGVAYRVYVAPAAKLIVAMERME